MDIAIIDELDTTIENLLHMEDNLKGIPVSFAVPSKDFSYNSLTVNCYLYDIRENTELRSNEPLIERYNDGTVVKKRPPVRIQFSYCITAWSALKNNEESKTREEHVCLSKVLTALLKYSTIPAEALSANLKGQTPPLPTTVVLPDGMKNPAEFWNAIGGPLKPFLDYRVTVSFDVHKAQEGQIVATHISKYRLGVESEKADEAETLITLGGIVTNSDNPSLPIKDAKLTLFDAQGTIVAETTTNAEGRYIFERFGIGTCPYTLKVEAQGYKEESTHIDEITAAKIGDFMITLQSV
jgi:hypothetical protein